MFQPLRVLWFRNRLAFNSDAGFVSLPLISVNSLPFFWIWFLLWFNVTQIVNVSLRASLKFNSFNENHVERSVCRMSEEVYPDTQWVGSNRPGGQLDRQRHVRVDGDEQHKKRNLGGIRTDPEGQSKCRAQLLSQHLEQALFWERWSLQTKGVGCDERAVRQARPYKGSR